MYLPYASPGQNAENAACAALVRLGRPMDWNRNHPDEPYTAPSTRPARTQCALALRQWRSTDKARARWFRSHMYRVGYPLKDSIR